MPRQPKPTLWTLAQAWDTSSNAVAKAMSTEQLASEAFARELEEADLGPEISMRQAFNILKAAFDPPKRQHRRKGPAVEVRHAMGVVVATRERPPLILAGDVTDTEVPPRVPPLLDREEPPKPPKRRRAPGTPTLIGPFEDGANDSAWEQTQWLDGFRIGNAVQCWTLPDTPRGIVEDIIGDTLGVRLENSELRYHLSPDELVLAYVETPISAPSMNP